MAIISVNIKDKTLNFKVDIFDLDEEIDIDELLKINLKYRVAELVTFPVILNRLGIVVADAENKVAEAKLDFDIFMAKERTKIKNAYEKNGEKYTISQIDNDLLSSPVYKAKANRSNNIKKQRDYINTIYWSAKDKSDKLNKLSLSFQAEDYDFDNLPKSFNGIKISVRESLIKS